jgi:hypothetical protein
MPDPIQSSGNSSVYDPNACDPSNASCVPPPAPASQAVTIEPVVIEGDAGRQALLQKYDADRCRNELGDATIACAMVGATAAGGGPVGAFLGAVNCARVIAAYDDCVAQNRSYREASDSCEARGGLPLMSARPNEIICEVPRDSSP